MSKHSTVQPEMYSVKDAAHILGITDTTLRKLETRGSIEFTRIGRKVLVSREIIDLLKKEGAAK